MKKTKTVKTRKLSPAQAARRSALFEAEEMVRRAASPYDHPDYTSMESVADEIHALAERCGTPKPRGRKPK